MADQEAVKLDAVEGFKPGSKELEALLAAGYGMDKKKAELIIKERAENPLLWPYEELQKAEAFMAALTAKPEAISRTPGWRRDRR